MGTKMESKVSNWLEDIQGLSQPNKLQSMDTPLTTEAATMLRPFCTVRRVLGQLMFRPANMALVCMWFTMTCRAATVYLHHPSTNMRVLSNTVQSSQNANNLVGITF